ncbi:MAG: hypothetical protein K0R31_1475 [Clostridiales bacterium]|nr:hypothetical protein [Clostridiales bacterium]
MKLMRITSELNQNKWMVLKIKNGAVYLSIYELKNVDKKLYI